jgi:hypothetical protein
MVWSFYAPGCRKLSVNIKLDDANFVILELYMDFYAHN